MSFNIDEYYEQWQLVTLSEEERNKYLEFKDAFMTLESRYPAVPLFGYRESDKKEMLALCKEKNIPYDIIEHGYWRNDEYDFANLEINWTREYFHICLLYLKYRKTQNPEEYNAIVKFMMAAQVKLEHLEYFINYMDGKSNV